MKRMHVKKTFVLLSTSQTLPQFTDHFKMKYSAEVFHKSTLLRARTT